MISVRNLVKRFGSFKAVNNISFDVKEGENLTLLGTSGCGKTTTLRMINRLIAADSGTIVLNGKDVSLERPELLRRGIGYVLQNHGLFPHYTIGENIAVVPRLLRWETKTIRKRGEELFEKLKLDPNLMEKFPADLSGGQQQRVGLARSLMVNPPVLLMDEPFGALDNLTRISVRKEFRELDELVKKTIIMVTHDVQEAFEMGDRICLMDQGEIKQIGSPEELLFKPANEFVKGFLNEQRLQLELKTVLLSDLFPEHFNSFHISSSTSHQPLSVWNKLESLAANDNADAGLSSDSITIENLMRAFFNYKNQ